MLDGSKFARLGARIGLAGLVLGAIGGTLAVSHAWRLTGLGLMLVGALVAFFGYVVPLADSAAKELGGLAARLRRGAGRSSSRACRRRPERARIMALCTNDAASWPSRR